MKPLHRSWREISARKNPRALRWRCTMKRLFFIAVDIVDHLLESIAREILGSSIPGGGSICKIAQGRQIFFRMGNGGVFAT